jgi:hypothetical protein
MRFILTGFTQNTGVRAFTFERIAADLTRAGFIVKTDLALTRKYDIRLQELPLLCRKLLERCDESEQERTFTFSEAEMISHASNCAVEREVRQKKNSMRKPFAKQVGATAH